MNTFLTPSICSYGALRRATRGIGQLYDGMIGSAGINAAQYNLLHTISRLDAPTQSKLAGEMVMDLSALGHTLKPLIRDGLVASRKDNEDARRRRITLTKAGEAKLHEAEMLWKQAQKRFDSLVGRTTAREFREMLDQLASPKFAEQFLA
ncbi:MarR family winged helix-turn-helix transcriptional regulator [Caballeronia sp.]|jgi:DNA-binding MarR family transcriptional regulator|uniref:MarR family winged helix-turn-helix transcriptional regulator n=1 Tax=Caballeronia sp. TaxID=1931223 RepID=UPI003C3A76B7